jgi:hypothetical protein
MNYAVKYLAGAYRVAGGNADRAVHYYAAGYYYAAKRKGASVPGVSAFKQPAAVSDRVANESFAESSPAGMNYH